MSNQREYEMFSHPDSDMVVSEWLKEKHATLWGRAFDLGDPDSLLAAARFFIEQTQEFATYVGAKLKEFNEQDALADSLERE